MSDRKLLIVFLVLQAFNIVFGLVNAVMACVNIILGKYLWASFSAAVTAFLVYNFVKARRKFLRFQREEREWRERSERELNDLRGLADFWSRASAEPTGLRVGDQYYPLANFVVPPEWTRQIRQQELDQCYQTKLCPDCGIGLLDMTLAPTVRCCNGQCASIFTVIDGKWSRMS